MITINPHINFNGNAEEAFGFYKSVFGGEVIKNEFLFILPIGQNKLIGNNVPEFLGKVSEEENRSKIWVSVESREEAEKIFNGLSVGGSVEMPLAESPWGTHFAMFRDKYGIEWEIEFDLKK